MSNYSIKDLEMLSGIKAHTLRIWEQRYNIIAPSRTGTNIRQYTSNDLKLLLNISMLNDMGFKISKIASMTPEELKKEVLIITDRNCTFSDQINALTLAMIEIDENMFEKIINKNVASLGIEKTLLNIVYPFLTKVGVMWQTGTINPSQEHFISNLIRQKLIVSIDGQKKPALANAKTFLLFLPEGELHELNLLFTHYIIKQRAHISIYLGQWLPFEDLVEIYKNIKPDFLITSINSNSNHGDVAKYVSKLSDSFSEAKILISGHQVVGQDLKLYPNILIMNKVDDFIDLIENLT